MEKFPGIGIKKTIHSKYGKVEVSKSHRFCRSPYGFQMSPYLQELVVFTGQNCVFEDGSEQLRRLSGVTVTAKQIERLTHTYGELLDLASCEEKSPVKRKEELHYCMIDGGMILTREDSWKELKLGRIFPAKAHMQESQKRNFIKESTYEAHLGGHTSFLKKVEKQTDQLDNMVWIADGARWIWNWVSSNYPESVQILDYFHCSEKLHGFAQEAFKDKEIRKKWASKQEVLLQESQTGQVLENIEKTDCKGKAKQLQRTLLTYYENNLSRMDYKTYRENGLLIGSGPMEAAHRHVIQCRMKLSGQRWTIKGAQQVINLRIANKSNQWKKVLNLINLN